MTTHYTLKSLLTWITDNKSKVLLGQFPDNARFAKDVPYELIDAIAYHKIAVRALNKENENARLLYNERVHGRFSTPTGFIGHPVYKPSNKPFKGGDDVVTVTGIILHPNLSNGELAFTYDYFDENGDKRQSYIRTTMVKPYFKETDYV